MKHRLIFLLILVTLFSFSLNAQEKLDIDGAIKIGINENTTPAAGTIRWNEAINDFEGFTGSEWKSLTQAKLLYGNSDISYNSTELNKLTASDDNANDNFGYSVSISGDYAIIGAYSDDNGGGSSGSAYVFKRSGTNWIQQDKLTASDAAANDYFGYSVSISGDYAIIGAYGDDDGGSNSGSAYIFKRTGTNWTQQDKLTGSNPAVDDYFGRSVSISGDYAIIGAYGDDDAGSSSGAAYVFKRSGSTWSMEDMFTSNDAAVNDYFGKSVSISGDYAIIGAHGDDDGGSSSGSAYIFKRSGTNWSQQDKLTASDENANDYFGSCVSIDGDYAVIGAWGNDDGGTNSGSAYIFKRFGTNWTEQEKLTASDENGQDNFGHSVSISGDYAIIGAYNNNAGGTNSGSAYIFKQSGTNWIQQAKLTASDAYEFDYFGFVVSIDGNYAIVGAWSNDDGGSNSGSAYIY